MSVVQAIMDTSGRKAIQDKIIYENLKIFPENA